MAKETNETTAAKAAKREPKAGDQISLRLANGEFAPATVNKVSKGGLVDLTAFVAGAEVVITSSPRDDSGTLPDSWQFPVVASE